MIDTAVAKEIQQAADRTTRYGILAKSLDVDKALDRSFTAASAGSN
jgi:sulfonate transport system substrate-binding protein